MKPQEKRVGIACMCVLSLVALPGLSERVANYASGALDNGTMQDGGGVQDAGNKPDHDKLKSVASMLERNETGEAQDMVESLFSQVAGKHNQACLPELFCEEMFNPRQWGSYQCYAADGFVGLYWGKIQDPGAAKVWEALESSGWERIGLTEQSSSFIKASGLYRWLNVGVFCGNGCMSVNINFRKEA